ncbi:MAG: amino acid ABC transporter permease [Coriobacteriales bacterium]|nr:amino acid ABC transporter permease [Coriobacteriales bacterium]
MNRTEKQDRCEKGTALKAIGKMMAVIAVLALVVSLTTPPQQAAGLTVEKATAKSNQQDGNEVIGGQPTRVTWEGRVAADEQISMLTLTFPEGTSLAEGASAKATVLDGLVRLEAVQDVQLDIQQAVITFEQPVASGLLLRVEIYNIALPAADGDYSIGGNYRNTTGEVVALTPSPPIAVISMTTVKAITLWLDDQPWVQSWNSVLFLRIFFNPQLIVASVPNLFDGWLHSLGLVLVGFPLAIPIGLGVSFLRMARLRIVRFISSIYVNIIRGTPLFLQIYIAFFGLPFLGISIDSYLLGILVLAMNSSAYLAEIFRAGIQSIHKGQFEASSSLGMNAVQTMFSVIIPQTVRRVIPTATSEFILLYKDTSLLAAVGVMEQMMFAKSMVASTGNMTPYIVAAGYYLLVTLPLTKIIASFERRLAAAEGSSTAPSSSKKRRRRLFAKPASDAPSEGVDADANPS